MYEIVIFFEFLDWFSIDFLDFLLLSLALSVKSNLVEFIGFSGVKCYLFGFYVVLALYIIYSSNCLKLFFIVLIYGLLLSCLRVFLKVSTFSEGVMSLDFYSCNFYFSIRWWASSSKWFFGENMVLGNSYFSNKLFYISIILSILSSIS